jgi:hypothetical protein
MYLVEVLRAIVFEPTGQAGPLAGPPVANLGIGDSNKGIRSNPVFIEESSGGIRSSHVSGDRFWSNHHIPNPIHNPVPIPDTQLTVRRSGRSKSGQNISTRPEVSSWWGLDQARSPLTSRPVICKNGTRDCISVFLPIILFLTWNDKIRITFNTKASHNYASMIPTRLIFRGPLW